MFDIGFTELIVIGVVALIVIGPERLPKVARTVGHLYGRMQRYVSNVRSDISREMQLDEIRRTGQSLRDSVESIATEAQQQATVVDEFLRTEAAAVERLAASAAPSQAEPEPASPDVKTAEIVQPSPQQNLFSDEPDQNPVPPGEAAPAGRKSV